MQKFLLFLLLVSAIAITGCSSSKSRGGSYKMYDKKAQACYYADKYNGRKTANGERFSNKKYTAAHRKLPFGTKVRVTNLYNNKSVVVTINDRGPFSGGFDIDLTRKAYMDIYEKGGKSKMQVSIEILK